MESGLVNIVLASLCVNYPPSNVSTTTTPYPTFTRSPRYPNKCILRNNVEFLRGRKLKIATLLDDMPFSNATANGTLDGVALELIQVLQERFGFSYELVLPEKNIIGNEEEGLFGLLYKGEVDMVAGFVPVVPGSNRMVKWGVNLAQNSYYVLMKRPKDSATGSGLLAPFETDVWILTLASLIGVGPVIYLVMKLRVRLCRDPAIKAFTLDSCFWFVYGAMMKQGSSLNPVTDSSRLIFATWWIFVMVLTAFYTANLTAFLTLSRFTLPIHNADEIAQQRKNWFALEGGAIEYAVMNNDDGDLGVLKPTVKKKRGRFLQRKDSLDLVKRLVMEEHLYLEENNMLRLFLLNDYMEKSKLDIDEKHRCTYVLTPNAYLVRNLAFAYPRESNLPLLFDPVLLSFVESGMIKHRVQEELPEATICPLDLDSKERQLRNTDLLTTYYLVASGFATAVSVLFLEIIVRRCCHPMQVRSWPVDVTSQKKLTARFNGTKSKQHPKVNINGREYYIVISKNGEKRYIPIRTPSALLFQYAPK